MVALAVIYTVGAVLLFQSPVSPKDMVIYYGFHDPACKCPKMTL
jgi:hypothetical protein